MSLDGVREDMQNIDNTLSEVRTTLFAVDNDVKLARALMRWTELEQDGGEKNVMSQYGQQGFKDPACTAPTLLNPMAVNGALRVQTERSQGRHQRRDLRRVQPAGSHRRPPRD